MAKDDKDVFSGLAKVSEFILIMTLFVGLGAILLIVMDTKALVEEQLSPKEVVDRPVLIADYDVVKQEAERIYFGRNESDRVNGFYAHKGYFCVATSGRSATDIAQTTFHELAHYYVHQDPDHFVGRYMEALD